MRRFLLVLVAIAVFRTGTVAQSSQSDFGGSYESLKPEQKALVDDWMKRFSATIHKPIDPREAYNNLPLSTRTTFNAVTHALISTQLTGESGGKLGPAIQIVDKVDTVSGEVLGARGDEQFRLYIQLKPDALNVLGQSREFRRMGDNTVYHRGYPICYRSKPSVPSIQVSATRDKTRADVDVDYKSSGFPKGLVNGHLSSPNSDVRAGRNDEIHNSQWSGLNNWWRNLLSLPRELKKDGSSQEVSGVANAKEQANKKPAEAVHDLLNTWLVEQKPQDVISYFARQAYACADLEKEESLDRGMAPFRLMTTLQEVNRRFGNISQLGDVLTAPPVEQTGARTKPVKHPWQGQFSLYDVREDAAEQFNCANRLDPTQISQKAAASKSFGKYYGAVFRIAKKDKTGSTTLATLWTRDEKNFWKLISYDVDPVWDEHRAPNTAASPPPAAPTEYTTAPDGLVGSATKFLNAWFVKQDLNEASTYLSSRSGECLPVERASGGLESKIDLAPMVQLRNAMQNVLNIVGKVKELEEAIVASPPNHEDIKLVKHAGIKAFALASVTDSMAAALDCSAGIPGEHLPYHPSNGASNDGKHYVTGFRLAKAGEDSGVLWALWSQEGSAWKLTAYTVLTP